jgi:hypothetical protein
MYLFLPKLNKYKRYAQIRKPLCKHFLSTNTAVLVFYKE